MLHPIFIELLYSENINKFSDLDDYLIILVNYKKNQYQNKSATSWFCDTFNTLGIEKLFDDNNLSKLYQFIKDEVVFVSKKYGVENNSIQCIDSWINLAGPGDFQEFHTHPCSHFSIVYYITVPENSGRIVFRSPRSQSMFPLPTGQHTQANCNTYVYQPKNNDLLIFRSDLLHMVEKNKSHQDRISVSANFSFTY